MNSVSLISPTVRHLTRRGTKAGRRLIRQIKPVMGRPNNLKYFGQKGVNFNNLVLCLPYEVKFGNVIPTRISCLESKTKLVTEYLTPSYNLKVIPLEKEKRDIQSLQLYTLNCRSVKNKALSICDYITSNNIDIMALTETWLGTDTDNIALADLVPDGFDIYSVPRQNRRGGGVALVYKTGLKVNMIKSQEVFTSFEHLECIIGSKNSTFRLCIIYRPPASKLNNVKTSVFFEEYSKYINAHVVANVELIITGDMNFPLNKPSELCTQKFMSLLKEHGLTQHVREPTHVHGHILDVVITRDNSHILKHSPCVDDNYICDSTGNTFLDHKGISCILQISKPSKPRKSVSYRKLRSIDIDKFASEIQSSMTYNSESISLSDLVRHYNDRIIEAIDNHAPLQTKVFTVRPNTQWYSSDLHTAKKAKRKAERVWRQSKLEVHRQIFKEKCRINSKLLFESKQTYYSSNIIECGNDTKRLYKLTNTLMGKNQDAVLPVSECDTALSNKFSDFFLEKIQSIRENLQNANNSASNPEHSLSADIKFTGQPLTEFSTASNEEIRKLLMTSPSKSCELDPMPTYILKLCLNEVLPVITEIVNKSISESVVPTDFKQAIVRPLLKKPGLDKDNFKNYRPVSNLPYVSKIIEKVVASRIENHLNNNKLYDDRQSAYRSNHSTETALLRVHHDIATALDSNSCAILVMLDLSAAFDIIDHDILFKRLEHTFGITGSALGWIQSYLTNRTQRVAIGSVLSDSRSLNIGVPQGSVLGPRLYCIFSKPIGDICISHDMNYHCYADDTQLYIVVEPRDNIDDDSTKLNSCLNDIREWMSVNLLKLNHDKTELMVFAPKRRIKEMAYFSISFGGNIIHDATYVKNLGAYFDQTLCMERQCNAVSRTCYFHIRNIGCIRPFISEDACKMLVNALVTSRLDYGNALLFGIHKHLTDKLQRVQNTAARMISRTKKTDHITPILIRLHWLPMEYRSQYKLLLYVFKALHGLAPVYLTELVKPYTPRRSLRSESELLLTVPVIKTKTYGERRFDKAASTLWNGLPRHLKTLNSLDAFKRSLKTYLFSQAYRV